jgi:aminopeptidase
MAELVVAFGANVQPGQIVVVGSDFGKEALTRAVARQCYQAGAVFVDVQYGDRHIARARVLYGSEDALGYEPAWTLARPRELAEKRGAMIVLSGPVETDVLADLDPERLTRDRPPGALEWMRISMERLVNWTVAACPTPEWAALVHPRLAPEAALDRLWEQVIYACRLDVEDPVTAWTGRASQLATVCAQLTEMRFDAIHLAGPGTDLTVGLLPSSTWLGLEEHTTYGLAYRPNLPSEEVFTTPDPARVDGVVRATRPVVLDGTIIHDLVVRFERGRAISIEASGGADLLHAYTDKDDGASRLGELALVDSDSRIGRMNSVFYDPLFDENAASHLAFGNAYPAGVANPADRERINASETHLDFMVGAPDMVVTGTHPDGTQVPVLVNGRWVF